MHLATRVVSLVVRRIEELGLWVAFDKKEALLFHGSCCGPPHGASIVVNMVLVPVQAQMKYLGLSQNNIEGQSHMQLP